MWDMQRGVQLEQVPPPPVTIAFYLLEPDGRRGTYWPGWLRLLVFASVAPVHDEPGAV